jgi:hypothetical protein
MMNGGVVMIFKLKYLMGMGYDAIKNKHEQSI